MFYTELERQAWLQHMTEYKRKFGQQRGKLAKKKKMKPQTESRFGKATNPVLNIKLVAHVSYW